ncbi:serine hydrolase domain-containing protein [Acidobacteriota bacterium]
MNRRSKIFRILSLVVFTALIFSFYVFSFAHDQVNEKQILEYLEQIRLKAEVPGVSAAVGVDGKIVFAGGVGFAELENQVPQTSTTVHNIGSISKTPAVVSIMQLVEQGKIKLDEPIQKYATFFPEKRWPITISNILTHTSGIRHYKTNVYEEFGPSAIKQMQYFEKFDEKAIDFFKDDPLLFKPGESWSYSSFATNLLQAVVEKASGMGYEEYLAKNIWMPAGMLSTAIDVPSRIIHKRGRGYIRMKGALINFPFVDVSYKYVGGGIISTVEDLVRFGQALNAGALLKEETVAKMYTVQIDPVMRFIKDKDPKKADFKQALIWRVDEDSKGRTFIEHGGVVRGTTSWLVNYPDKDVVVAIHTNYHSYMPLKGHAVAIAQLFLPHKKGE